MKLLSTLFEYTYYRVTRAYYKWDINKGITAIFAIAMFQTLIISDFLIFILKLFYNRSETMSYSKQFALAGCSLFIILSVLNHLRFKDKYEELKLRWENENTTQRRIRGILLIIMLVIPWSILILLGQV